MAAPTSSFDDAGPWDTYGTFAFTDHLEVSDPDGGVWRDTGTTTPLDEWSIEGRRIWLEVWPIDDTGTGWFDWYIYTVSPLATNYIEFDIRSGDLIVYAKNWPDGFGGVTTIGPYDPVNHRWLAISERDGTVRFEASPDGSDWSILASFATSILPGTTFSGFEVDLDQDGGPAGTWAVDNLGGEALPTIITGASGTDERAWGESTGWAARVDVLDPGGAIVASTATASSGIVLVSGNVSEDLTQNVTRACSVRLLLENQADGSRHPLLPSKPGDPLDPRSGGGLAIYAGPLLPSGTPALVKLGVFRITAASPASAAVGDSLSIRGLSQESTISSVPFFDAFNVADGTLTTTAIRDMVIEALPNVELSIETSAVTLPASGWSDNDNRMTTVADLANSLGMVARFDREGRFRVQHVTETGDAANLSPRWTFTEGANAVMRDVSREITDTDLYNGVVVVGEPKDAAVTGVRAVRWDTNPISPIYYDPNNPGASRVGPRPKKVVSPLVYTQQQADDLATVELTKILAYPDRITVTVTANPSIEVGDIARIIRTTMGVNGLYQVEQVAHDLLGAASKITCVART